MSNKNSEENPNNTKIDSSRNEVISTDSGFSEIIENMNENENPIPAPRVTKRAQSEEPSTSRSTTVFPPNFTSRKNIFKYLERHGMDPLKRTNWWIPEEDSDIVATETTTTKTSSPPTAYVRALSVPSIKTRYTAYSSKSVEDLKHDGKCTIVEEFK